MCTVHTSSQPTGRNTPTVDGDDGSGMLAANLFTRTEPKYIRLHLWPFWGGCLGAASGEEPDGGRVLIAREDPRAPDVEPHVAAAQPPDPVTLQLGR